MGIRDTLVATGAALAVASASADTQKIPQSSPEVSNVLSATASKVEGLHRDVDTTILVAQANIEDGKTGPYKALIPQIGNGKIKEIKFYRDKDGAIIPPDVVDGKLLDGSDAPTHPLRAKNAQVKILAKYDPINISKIEKKDMALKASKEIGNFTTLAEQSKLDKDGLYQGFSTIYLVKLGLGSEASEKTLEGLNIIMDGLGKYGRTLLKMSTQEIEQMKKRAEQNAQDKLNTTVTNAA